jgi:hypothetical protein
MRIVKEEEEEEKIEEEWNRLGRNGRSKNRRRDISKYI